MRRVGLMVAGLALAATASLEQEGECIIELRPQSFPGEYRRRQAPPAWPDTGHRPHQGKRERERRLRRMAKKA